MTMILNPYSFGSAMSLSFVGAGVATGNTISIPAGAAIGDLAILLEYGAGGSDPTAATPSGWTVAKSLATAGLSTLAQAFYRTLAAASGSIVTGSTYGSGGDGSTCMFVYRPSKAISSVTASTWNGELSAGNVAAQSVDPSLETNPVIVLGLGGANSSAFSFSVASPAFDAVSVNDSGSGYANFGRKLYNSAPASHSIDIIDEGTRNALISGYLAVS